MNGGELGFFDIVNPVLAQIENVLFIGMPPVVRLTIWGIFAAIVSMSLYRLLSPQDKIKMAGANTRKLIRELATYDGDFNGLTLLTRSVFYASSRHFLIILGPAVLASLPILFLLSWLSYSYNEQIPAPDEQVTVTVTPVTTGLTWTSSSNIESLSSSEWEIAWPDSSAEVTLKDGSDAVILTLPLQHAVGILHKKMWWNVLFANPIGYLPDSSKFDVVLIHLPTQQILDFGPSWMRGWEATFFCVVILCSLLIKFGFRVH